MKSHTIIADKFVFGGNCIGKIDGKTVFVPYAVPGEKLDIEITKEHKDFDEGRILNVLEPSFHRVKPFCSLYGKCGGCDMMHIDGQYQKEIKSRIFTELFSSNGIKIPAPTTISGKDAGYRARIQLNDGCFSERGSNRPVPVDYCPVAHKNINDWLKAVPAEKRGKGRKNIFAHEKLKEKLIVSHTEEKIPQKEARNNAKLKKPRNIYSGSIISEENRANINILGKNISFDVRGFFQSNIEVLEKAILKTTEDISGSSALDLYAGCGTFSAFLCDKFENVTLVEHNRDALVYAEKNLYGKPHTSIGLSGEAWIRSCGKMHFDAAVLDPPRSGIEKTVLDYLCASKIPRIRYVSCNPSTQARDIARLFKSGYGIKEAFVLDFYPNTSHIESLVCLERED